MKCCKELFLFACLCSYLLVSVVAAAELDFSKRKAIDSAIVAEMEKQEVVGLAIGIIQDGEVVYTQGYGYADLSKKRKVNSATLFRWASVAKPMTAVAAMQLVEAGKLDLDEDVMAGRGGFFDLKVDQGVGAVNCAINGIADSFHFRSPEVAWDARHATVL